MKIIKHHYMVIAFLAIAFVLVSLIFKDKGWQSNTQARVKIYEKDYPNLYSIERAKGLLEEVNYASIVYPTASLAVDDDWFSRNILPPEHSYGSVKADVVLTILGKDHKTIEYGAESAHLSNHAVFVALCNVSDMGLYQPDTGFIFPATEELIEYMKKNKERIHTEFASSNCKE